MSVVDPLAVPATPLTRPPTSVLPPAQRTPSFVLSASNRSYKHQYANIYFARLQLLRKYVLARARRRWKDVSGKLCYIIGTVYMDMPLKPNVLEDIGRDVSLSPCATSAHKYHSPDDQVMLEDESGRIVLVGERLRAASLVTGVIVGVLGIETNGGEFEIVDVCYAGMAPQPSKGLEWAKQKQKDSTMDVDGALGEGQGDEWVALVSGLEIGAPSPADAQIQMLIEYLSGEAGGPDDQAICSRISRLVIAGNSFSHSVSASGGGNEDEKEKRRYGHDPANFSHHPTLTLSAHLLDIARSMPVHILPGASDPAGTLLPQQPFPRAMFRGASAYASFSCETNPTYIRVGPPSSFVPPAPETGKGKQKASASTSKGAPPPESGPSRTILVSSGQPVEDMYKYLPSPPHTRLALACESLKWRHLAPTAPDTLWCHPYFAQDPFVLAETPDVYVVGNQPAFGTRTGGKGMEGEGGEKRCRVVLVPAFRKTGVVVLLNLRTLAVRTLQFAVDGMGGAGEAT
ncbi:DNA polymerase alpha/epsilon subunit B-domain-containing protein [Fomitopsis serialis]|uniref:DNA polymerase alpha/epsilon subunit B-domain-containing protein n=1 Tax=Fomitopsis serialis TaxID=139415 RepID=UPI00200888D1|nr:DNA polymerase alpha/epsilon subunit B-domain-containing protein [Neoantrodia serialis]KAH9934898.1 DNA polymerase alpha/epsilon subunit B-domain-containing protein [Neoantrodia serialis]